MFYKLLYLTIILLLVAIGRYLRFYRQLKLKNKDIIDYLVLISNYIRTIVISIHKNTNESFNIDIEKELNTEHVKTVFSHLEKQRFINSNAQIQRDADYLVSRLEALNIVPSANLSKFIDDSKRIQKILETHNSKAIQRILEENKDFFDHCLTYPLDEQQRRSIVSEEDNCLVVSSAGSGKTSSIIGKVKYLTNIKHI